VRLCPLSSLKRIIRGLPSNLRIGIGGHWSAHDFAEFMRSLDDLYNAHFLVFAIENRGDQLLPIDMASPIVSETLRDMVLFISPEGGLRVVQIEHSSPGITDFAGIGKDGGIQEVCLWCLGPSPRQFQAQA